MRFYLFIQNSSRLGFIDSRKWRKNSKSMKNVIIAIKLFYLSILLFYLVWINDTATWCNSTGPQYDFSTALK